MTLPEFSRLVGMKEKTSRASSGLPEPVSKEEIEALADDLRDRGIIDDKGLVKHGRSN